MKNFFLYLLLLLPLPFQIVKGQEDQVLEHARDALSLEIHRNHRTSIPARHWLIGIYPGKADLLAPNTIDASSLTLIGIPKQLSKDFIHPKHGWSLHGDVHYLFTDHIGLGVKYALFTSSAQQNIMLSTDEYSPPFYIPPANYPGTVNLGFEEKLFTHYAGLSVLFRQWLNSKHRLQVTETISAGYVHYRNEMRQAFQYPNNLIPNHLVKSNTWGAYAGLSMDYYLQSWLSIGVKADVLFARLTNMNFSTEEIAMTLELGRSDYEYLTRLDYALAIRFHF